MKRQRLYDYLWYIIGTIIPILIKLLQSPIFTREFTTLEYGFYSLVLITYTYLSLGLFGWLSNCLWRYYLAYKNRGELKVLLTNILFLFTISSILLMIISYVWLKSSINSSIHQLIIFGLLQFLIEQLISFYLIIIRLEGKAKKYGVIRVLQTTLSFVFLCLLVFSLNFRIEALLICNLVINGILLIYVLFEIRSYLKFSFNFISKKVIEELLSFGFIVFITNFCLIVLTNSDRYFIAYFTDINKVGIYNQLYYLSQISIMAGVTIFFNIVTPYLFNILENKPVVYDVIVKKSVLIFTIVLLPIAIYISIFSKEVSTIMLGAAFRDCYSILPLIVFGNYLYGLVNFTEIKFKFQRKYSKIILIFAFAAIINVVLNIVLIPRLGYKIAGTTTFISYFLLWAIIYIQDKNYYLNYLLLNKNFRTPALVLIIQIVLYFVIRRATNLNNSIVFVILEAGIFALAYIVFNYRRVLKLI